MITLQRVSKAGRKAASLAAFKLRAAVGVPKDRTCAACNRRVVGFFTYGVPDWGCPECGASSRERLINFCLDKNLLAIPQGASILHIAPSEMSLARRFRKLGKVVFGDISPEHYSTGDVRKVDLMDMSPLGQFDLFYASHVMEHVPDDRRVLKNIYDHLSPGGQAWIIVPLHDAPTIDGGTDLSPMERERRFGQWDHVRQYGVDIVERIQQAGFAVTVLDPASIPHDTHFHFGLSDDDKVFVGRKAG